MGDTRRRWPNAQAPSQMRAALARRPHQSSMRSSPYEHFAGFLDLLRGDKGGQGMRQGRRCEAGDVAWQSTQIGQQSTGHGWGVWAPVALHATAHARPVCHAHPVCAVLCNVQQGIHEKNLDPEKSEETAGPRQLHVRRWLRRRQRTPSPAQRARQAVPSWRQQTQHASRVQQARLLRTVP